MIYRSVPATQTLSNLTSMEGTVPWQLELISHPFSMPFLHTVSESLIASSMSYDFMSWYMKTSYCMWESILEKADHFYRDPANALLEEHSPHLLDHCKQRTEEDDWRREGRGDGWCWRYVMVVVVVVDSVRWLHCDVTINDADQRGRRRLDHRTEERRKESRNNGLH